MHKNGPGKLSIAFRVTDQTLTICVEDNGVGRSEKKSGDSNTEKKSFGVRITSERLKLIEKVLKLTTSIKILDLKDTSGHPQGTRVVITMPVIRDAEARIFLGENTSA